VQRLHCISTTSRSAPAQPSRRRNAKVVTLAGLGTPEKPHPLQTAYVEEQVPQCGYCISSWIMTAAAFLRDKEEADRRRDQDGAGRPHAVAARIWHHCAAARVRMMG
jgi:aerobic-type carbon monoxide dehydrogenase small subunit (CoxS/CutS family)